MNYKDIKYFSKIWNINSTRIRKFCRENRIPGVIKKGKIWLIPENAQKPKDKRFHSFYEEIFNEIDKYKNDVNIRIAQLSSLELKKIKENFIIENTYNTNAIEGNTMTLQETALVLEGITIDQKPIKEHLELIGHKEAFNWLEDCLKYNVPISTKLIKEIHSLVLMNRKQDAGIYRNIPVYISGSDYQPIQPYLIEKEMEQLIRDYNKLLRTKHVIEAISWFHLKFESIHPFIDGNGRTGRLLINYELMKNKYLPIDIKYRAVKQYYQAFISYKAMTELIANYILSAFKEFIKQIKKQ